MLKTDLVPAFFRIIMNVKHKVCETSDLNELEEKKTSLVTQENAGLV